MQDKFNREINYIRISLTDRCNLRCKYCMPSEGICKLRHEDMLSLEEILEIIKASAELGISKVRLTGGEPLVRKNIVWLCEEIKKIPDIKELAITTNGTLLAPMATDLKNAGADRINISLDSLNAEKYKLITRGGSYEAAMDGIHAALAAGFKKVKINTVLLGGFNLDEIQDFGELTKNSDIDVRFIELMPMPDINSPKESFVPNSVVLEKIQDLEYLGTDGVAEMYTKPSYMGRIGLISPVSCSFCNECNKIRLTADGFIKPCLHSKEEISIKGMHGKELETKLEEIILSKPKEHDALDFENNSKAARAMNKIGG